VARSVSQITIPIKYITNTKALGTAQSKFAKFGGAIAGIAAASTAAIAGIGAAAVKMSAEFETNFAKIQGLVGVAAEDLGVLEDAAKRLGPQFGKSANEAADALFFITSAGLRGADAVNVLEASLKGAAIGLGDTKTIADLATSAVNAYGAANLDGTKAVDILAEAVREGKLEPAELAGSMGQVLPVASAMGVGFDEVGAAMAAMSRTGTDASSAATQLRGIMNALIKPTKEAEDTLAGLGLSAEGLREQMGTEGLLPTLETLTTAFDGNIEATASVFGNVRALTGVLDLMGSNVEGTRAIFANMTDDVGALDSALDVTSETAAFKFNRALETAKASLLPVGDVLLDIGAKLLDSLLPTIEKLGPVFEETFEAFAPALDELFELLPGLIDALLPLLPVIGDIATIVLDLVTALLPPFVALLEALMPIFELLTGVVEDLVVPLVEMLAPVLTDIFEAVGRIIEAAMPVFIQLLETLIPIVLELVEMFLPLLDYILPLLEAYLLDLVVPALEIFAEMLGVILPFAMEMFKTFGLGRLLVAMGDFSEDFQMIVYNIRKWWAESFNSMIVHLENWLNAAVRGLNWFIDKANSLPGVEINFRASEITLGRLDMPDLPRFLQQQINENMSRVDTTSMAGIMEASGASFARGISTRDFLGTGSLSAIERLSQPGSGVTPFADGGIVTRPVIGMVGEAGPEAIIPLNKAGSLGGTYNITVNAGMGANGSQIGEEIVRAIKKYERQSGPVFASA
jgi:TP901 family phage tail tape measure protein